MRINSFRFLINMIKDREDKTIRLTEFEYLRSLLYIVSFLFNDLEKLLFFEGRYFGITVIYMKIVRNSYRKIKEDDTTQDLENFGRVLYLFKPSIMREYKKLRRRHVSEADCVIAIIKKILDIIIQDNDNPYYKNIKSLQKLITKLYDNIRNNGKSASMYSLVSNIKNYMNSGVVGKYPLTHFSVIDEERKKERGREILGSETKLDLNSDFKNKEIKWIE